MDAQVIMDSVAQAFAKERIKRQVHEVTDINVLRGVVIELMDVIDRQKQLFLQMLEQDLHYKIKDSSPDTEKP